MAISPLQERLVRVAKAKNGHLRLWREGANLVQQGGQPVDDLLKLAAVARWRFAYALRGEGNRGLRLTPPMYRFAVTRFYYAMYHAMRAVMFVEYDGDDHEQHNVLPTKEVANIPQATGWQNKLKDARTYRNQADYDPYPLSDVAWRDAALQLRAHANELLILSRTYLSTKGCVI